jgi:hypothetical protein
LQIRSAILIFLLDVVVLGTIVATTELLATGSRRLYVLGTICSAISVSMYAAPMAVLVSGGEEKQSPMGTIKPQK